MARQVLEYIILDTIIWIVAFMGIYALCFSALGVNALWLVLIASFISLIPFVYAQGLNLYQTHKGYAKWMSQPCAKQNGFFKPKGVLLGKKWGTLVRAQGYEHILCVAPSGAGKTTSLVIPNLLSWDESCVVLDIKQELFAKTSGFRTLCGSECFLFNPGRTDIKTHRYNPLSHLPKEVKAQINAIQKIAHILYPDRQCDPIWITGPRNLFVALTMYVVQTQTTATLSCVLKLIKRQDSEEIFEAALDDTNLADAIHANLSEYLSYPDKTRASIKASLIAGLYMFENPMVAEATSCSDFDIRDLRKKNMSIYVGISNDNLIRLAPLINIFFQQVLTTLTQSEPSKDEPFGVLMCLDEFAALGKMDLFEANIGLLRSYHVRLMMIVQDLAQLYSAYGHHGAQSFINVKTRLFFAQNAMQSAELISSMAGLKPPKVNKKGASVSFEPLISAQQILRLDKSHCLVLTEGLAPLMLKKCIWFKDKRFKQRAINPIEVQRRRH